MMLITLLAWASVARAALDYGPAVACPTWSTTERPTLPACPPSGKLLPETYPVQALIVSDDPYAGDGGAYTVEVVTKALKASGDQIPAIILPVSDDTLQRVKKAILAMDAPAERKRQWIAAMNPAPDGRYTWQQDFMQPFFDPASGQPVLRTVENYYRGRYDGAKNALSLAAAKCGMKVGPELKTAIADNYVNGFAGGNIETLPGGVCLLGADQFNDPQAYNNSYNAYADQICGPDPADRIKVPTSFLDVGHTDEVMKVMRDNTKPAPCNFAVAVASPKKALELMMEEPDKPFFNFRSGDGRTQAQLADARVARGVETLCRQYRQWKDQQAEPKTPAAEAPSRSVTAIPGLGAGGRAPAGAIPVYRPEDDPQECAKYTSRELHDFILQDQALRRLNHLIQTDMDGLKVQVTRQMKRKFPQCEIDIMDVPDLFYGGVPVQVERGEFELPLHVNSSLLPNPTNAITIGDTIMTPEPNNDVFRAYLEKTYRAKGLKPEFVDTYEYAHLGYGNLHCTTQTIHTCRPAGGK